MTRKHFYIYNECYKSISATVKMVEVGQVPVNHTHIVSPGSQDFFFSSENDQDVFIEAEAVSQDGALHWPSQKIVLKDGEYTHVITCHCKIEECPMVWPPETTRQFPIEDS